MSRAILFFSLFSFAPAVPDARLSLSGLADRAVDVTFGTSPLFASPADPHVASLPPASVGRVGTRPLSLGNFNGQKVVRGQPGRRRGVYGRQPPPGSTRRFDDPQ